MTTEMRVFVCIPDAAAQPVLELCMRAENALARSRKSPPGDRTEFSRFEALHCVIDQLATVALSNGEPCVVETEGVSDDASGVSVLHAGKPVPDAAPAQVQRWVGDGRVVVEMRLPHHAGQTQLGGTIAVGPPAPASRWISTAGRPKDAVRERFEYLITRALSDGQSDEAVISPSGVDNSVLTEGLRDSVVRRPGTERVDLPVRYRDGSEGARFPLRALNMTDSVPAGWRVLRFTLMSIRHVEMDHIVDGAWLRNARISRSREAGLTDQIVFETSLRQLAFLGDRGPTVIHMYQTGLQPAVVGFYRAVVHHLISHPGTIVVVPRFFVGEGQFVQGQAWATV